MAACGNVDQSELGLRLVQRVQSAVKNWHHHHLFFLGKKIRQHFPISKTGFYKTLFLCICREVLSLSCDHIVIFLFLILFINK